MISTQVSQEFVDLRLDKFLCKKFDISFALAQKLIREKKVKVNEKRVDQSYKIQDCDQIRIFADLPKRYEKIIKTAKISDEKSKKFWQQVIYEDDNIIAINKPSSLATQGGSGIDISVDDFISLKKYQLVHRLDKDTSGVLLIAKNNQSADFLTLAFKNKAIRKTYLAIVDGVVKKTNITINIPLAKKKLGKNEKVLPDFEHGKSAITELKTIKTYQDYSIVELSPLTGRTHQLRVHCKEIGHPIINDVKYGGMKVLRKEISQRLCLHAYMIEISDYYGKNLIIKTKKPEFLIQI